MPNKPGWLYKYSETLKQETAYHCASGWIFCKDGTKYSPSEIKRLQTAEIKAIPLKVHTVKKMLEGTIVDIRHKTPIAAISQAKQSAPIVPQTEKPKVPAAVQKTPASARPEPLQPLRQADDIYDEYGRLQIW